MEHWFSMFPSIFNFHFHLDLWDPNGIFFGLGQVSKTVFVSSLQDEKVLFSVPPLFLDDGRRLYTG